MKKLYYVHNYCCLSRVEKLKLQYELYALGEHFWLFGRTSRGWEYMLVRSDLPLDEFISHDYFMRVTDKVFYHDILTDMFKRVV